MTISYNWLSEYLYETVEPQKLSKILTSIGLEVESLEPFENIKGGLEGIVIGEVTSCQQHPNADKLKLTEVNIGNGQVLKIVCGASNVAIGQKVLVAKVGTTIYPTTGEPLTLKTAKIRGEESQGMICAEDELGLGTSHEGIMVLPQEVMVGTLAKDYFTIYQDWIYEIGLTPNRMDAMSHMGVARDVTAYLTHHQKADTKVKTPFANNFKIDSNTHPIHVVIENKEACQRYSGISIKGITVQESPSWLKHKLLAIGQRPINNIVDITNFVLHETGQPLHAFDFNEITGKEIIVKNLPQDSAFTTLDEKERKLNEADLMICNAESGMCIAGVFGGIKSGVTSATTDIFLESAWFQPESIRKTSLRHGLRTEAATRFEKGVDISNTVNVLKRAALLIKEIAGGEIASDIIDVYPNPKEKTQVGIKYHYLKKLSGKNYHPDTTKKILTALGFEVVKEGIDELWVSVPFSKPDITLPADIVEEILRIDGLDNVEITGTMNITPAIDENIHKENLKEKIAGYLTGLGYNEILTNSITNSAYYNETQISSAVKMLNNLSEELDVLRPSMVETGMESIVYNINRKNNNLQFFEFGKTYSSKQTGKYHEVEHLCMYLTGQSGIGSWKEKAVPVDFYKAKGLATAIFELCGFESPSYSIQSDPDFEMAIQGTIKNEWVCKVAEISKQKLKTFDIKQPVFYIDFQWETLCKLHAQKKVEYTEISKFPAVHRDLALVINKQVTFEQIETALKKAHIQKLQTVQLFDIFENEKLGADKKSMALSFTFVDEEKTLTDKESETMMGKIINTFEKELGAEIRK